MANVSMSAVEFANRMAAMFESKDTAIQEILDNVQNETQILLDDVPNASKYNSILSVEYLLVRARIQLETERISIKRILSSKDTPETMKSIFMKRDQYLAQVSMQLNSIRDDISVLQKVAYANSFIK